MSKLLAMLFDGPHSADEARTTLYRMRDTRRLDLKETTVIANYGGGDIRLSVDTIFSTASRNASHRLHSITAAIAGVSGRLPIGAADPIPVAAGQRRVGDFIVKLGHELRPQTSALLMFLPNGQCCDFLNRLRQYYPRPLEIELPGELGSEIRVRPWSVRSALERRWRGESVAPIASCAPAVVYQETDRVVGCNLD